MTLEQFKRWEGFATKMAAKYPDVTEQRRKKIAEQVAHYFYWRHFQNDWPMMEDWDGNEGNCCVGDEVTEFFEKYLRWNERKEEYVGKFYDQITCCIRAGFDLAVKQSGGVVGFTAGDIREIFDGDVPDWVTKGWMKDNEPIDFSQIPDDACLWL
jgi:hypothetical protein